MSPYFVPGLVLLCCAPAFFVDPKLIKSVFILAAISLVAGGAASAWPRIMPPNFFLEHPALADTPLQPVMASLLGGILVLFGVGLLLALGCRALWYYIESLKK